MPTMRELVADLEARREKIRKMGGADKIAVAKAAGYSHVIDYRADDFAVRVVQGHKISLKG